MPIFALWGASAIHYLAKTKLGIKTYENLSELHTQTDVPSCIKSVVIQSVITECVYFVITINMDASNGCVTIEFSLTTYSASQIRPVAMTRLVLSAILKRNCTLTGNSR